ncbi:MAG: type II toxin-antitoxin system PemK/MazF family toxin [Dehalococcoidales bacterium]|nr:type II toxin-antitoxin system PemK/MazF family toxin [Dehalococcoidales bacterium]
MTKLLEVKRGDIYMVDWGGEIGEHPALIIQNDIGNRYSNSTIVAYITHTVGKGLPVLVEFKDHEASLPHGGSIDLGRIMTIPKTMLGNKVGRLSSPRMLAVKKAIMDSLGIA